MLTHTLLGEYHGDVRARDGFGLQARGAPPRRHTAAPARTLLQGRHETAGEGTQHVLQVLQRK